MTEPPHHIGVDELPEAARFRQLSTHSKHLVNTVKMLAYRAETAMANSLREHLKRPDDARRLLRALYTTEADLLPEPKAGTLTVHLRHAANAAPDQAIAELCEELNATETLFPRTNLRLVLKKERGTDVGLHQVARVMRVNGIRGVSRRKGWRTTVRDERLRPAPDLVQRNFSATAPDELWVADITYVPTEVGFLFLAVVLDAVSRRVVGWAMATHLRTELVLMALDMALSQRRPKDVIHHSDQGSQYTSISFGKRCDAYGVRPSMGSVGDCYDNAMAESFFATLECEFIDRVRLRTTSEAKRELFSFIEGWYNDASAS